MKLLTLEKINDLSAKPDRCMQDAPLGNIDFSCPFVPEIYTQLYFTDSYSQLSFEEKLHYNQLFGARMNEQFLVFEEDFTNTVLRIFLQCFSVSDDLKAAVEKMILEENIHSSMFEKLNRASFPDLFQKSSRFFTKLSFAERKMSQWILSFPGMFMFPVWLIPLLEEYSLKFSKDIMGKNSGMLGSLEENYVRVHAEHKKDEVRHVHIDIYILEKILSHSGSLKKKINRHLLVRFLRKIIIPRRSGPAVVKEFVKRNPRLREFLPVMLRQSENLSSNQEFVNSLFHAEMMPVTDYYMKEFTGIQLKDIFSFAGENSI
ncbi:MAG: hypothetical protein OEZ34_12215 [Spirochaetia bacterium]|nr:hypothetical protein [Spirochaetia bacterium]